MDTDVAPAGQVWVCAGCGKTSQTRDTFPDTACMTWAVLCYAERGPGGKWTAVRAADASAPTEAGAR